jgi:hypothetical protein
MASLTFKPGFWGWLQAPFQDIWHALLTTFGLVSGQFDIKVVFKSQRPVAAGILAVTGVFTLTWVRTPAFTATDGM